MISYNSLDLYESCHLYPGGLSYEYKTKTSSAPSSGMAGRFAEQKASGLTVRQWCEVNHFSFHTYNYWKHLKEEVVDQVLPGIVPISVSAVPLLEATEVAPVKELVSLQWRCANNLNQVAIHANTFGVYPEEIAGLQRDYEKL